jgi:dihydrodipicolinate synthase/N-acetylneuraminate lyase
VKCGIFLLIGEKNPVTLRCNCRYISSRPALDASQQGILPTLYTKLSADGFLVISRRRILAAAAFLSRAEESNASGALRGVFPILPAPYGVSRRLDGNQLALEIEALHRSGAHGMVWPPPGCELSAADRLLGAEIVIAAAQLPVILNVQGEDIESTRRFARHAEKIEPRAVMAALSGQHCRAIAGECGLPLLAQAGPGESIEFMLRMRDEIKTLRLVEDSIGQTLSRISEYRRAAPELAVFTSGRGRTMPDQLERGASGVMLPARFSRAYVRIWSQCLAGLREQAIADLSQIEALLSESA